MIRFEEIREWPSPPWGVIAGEIVHNLRSALDGLVWQLVLLHGDEEPGEHNQFPIYTTDKLKKPGKPERLASMLRGVGNTHRAFIEEVQPYLGSDSPHDQNHRFSLDWLQWLSNTDKHRFLHPTFCIRERGAKVSLPMADQPGGPVEVQTSYGVLYEGAEFIRWRTTDTPDAQVYLEAEIPANVGFGDPGITLARLISITEWVAAIVERFRPDFP